MGGVALGALAMVGFAIVASGTLAHAPDRIAFGAVVNLTVTATLVAWWSGVKRSGLASSIALAALAWGVVVGRIWVADAPLGMLVAIGGMTEVVTMGWLMLRWRYRHRQLPR